MARSLKGIVVSDKPHKSVVVLVSSSKTHSLYKKRYTIGKRFMVHDEKNEAAVGDKVVIVECRPLSASKHHTLKRIVEKAPIKATDAVEKITAETIEAVVPAKSVKAEAPKKAPEADTKTGGDK